MAELTHGPLPTLGSTFGAMLISLCTSSMLYGLALHQTYRYFKLFPNDTRTIKIWVIVVIVLETLTVVFVLYTCYWFMIVRQSNLSVLREDVWSFRLSAPTMLGAVIATHSFYARRIFYLGRQYWPVVALAGLLILAETGFTVAATVLAFKLASVDKFSKFIWVITTMFSISLAADVVLTSTLLFVLVRSRTGFKSTNSMLDTLIIYTVNTGLVTGIFALLTFIFTFTNPNDLIYIAVAITGTKMYSNSFLAMLNSRKALNNRSGLVDEFESGGAIQLARMSASTSSRSNPSWQSNSKPPTTAVINIAKAGHASSRDDGDDTESGLQKPSGFSVAI